MNDIISRFKECVTDVDYIKNMFNDVDISIPDTVNVFEEYVVNANNKVVVSTKYIDNLNVVFSALSKYFKLNYNNFKFNADTVEILFNNKILYKEFMGTVYDLSEMEDDYYEYLITKLKVELFDSKCIKITSKLTKVIK